jgi:hypothetical protein
VASVCLSVRKKARRSCRIEDVTGCKIAPVKLLLTSCCPPPQKVRSVPVVTRQIAPSSLELSDQIGMALYCVEKSLRLDAVAAAGFRMSRGKMLAYLKTKNAVKWVPCINCAVPG